MTLLNFSHPLTPVQVQQIKIMISGDITRIIDVPVHFDANVPYSRQIATLLDKVNFNAKQWQNELILLNPPSFNFIAVTLLAELHGRMGYYPPCVRLRPVPTIPPQFEVVEIINLNEIREQARKRREAVRT